ncbi:NAD(P)-binding protein [Bimuria novae-zelandiae CBS 107.79]|uniref:NAD(P)-binding protein n=1 Tax=Bimuria novae-zelandiae CBS 107.79 TaxID=1447943 RepID=A0A6A5VIP9_9PLEO|nr:NAD(P)-binding protein [Bimuria novae-zelandiae CBS 107.79]
MDFKRSVIITGGTMNMGYHAALTIARQHPEWLVVLSSRSDSKHAADAINTTLSQKNTIYLPLDLSSTQNIRTYAKDWTLKGYPPIQALLLNAALQFPGEAEFTEDGIEKTFAITHAGHALLFHLLVPHLATGARVVVTASGVHDPKQPTGMPHPVYTTAEALAHPPTELAKGDGRVHYVNTKLSNVLWTYALQKRLDRAVPEHGVSVNSMDPGLMLGTGLTREYSPIMRWVWTHLFPKIMPILRLAFGAANIKTPQQSGEALARLAMAEEFASVKGKYFQGTKEQESSVESYEVKKQDDLWEWTVKFAARDSEELAQFERFA